MPEGNQMNSDHLTPGMEEAALKDKQALDAQKSLELQREGDAITQDEEAKLSSEITSMDLSKAKKAFEKYKEINSGSLDLSAKNFEGDINYNAAINMVAEKSPDKIAELAKLGREFAYSYDKARKSGDFITGGYGSEKGEFTKTAKSLGYKAEGFFGFDDAEAIDLVRFLHSDRKSVV